MRILSGAIKGGASGAVMGLLEGCLKGENAEDILAYTVSGAKNGIKKGIVMEALEEGMNLIENRKISDLIPNIPETLIPKKGYPLCLLTDRCQFENNHSAQSSCCKAHEEDCPLMRLVLLNDCRVNVCLDTERELVTLSY